MECPRIAGDKIKSVKQLEGRGKGSVWKGTFGDRDVALKKLNIITFGGLPPKRLQEILMIYRFGQHPNIVELLGLCEKKGKTILVYEYMSGGILLDRMKEYLNTIQRFQICLGAARGLDYLHTGVDSTTPGMVHGGVNLSKILLNLDPVSGKYEAKVFGFGLSTLVPGQSHKIQESTKEDDVCSFGVLLLEVVYGTSGSVSTKDGHRLHVTDIFSNNLEESELRKKLHSNITNEVKTKSLNTYMKIARQCVKKNRKERPTMAQVVKELEKALTLQLEEVSVEYSGSQNNNGAQDETAVDDGMKEAGKGAPVIVTVEKEEEEDNDMKVGSYILDKTVKINEVANPVGDASKNEISIVDTYSISTVKDDITMQQPSFVDPILDSSDDGNLPSRNDIENTQTSTNHPETTEEINNDSDSKGKSNIGGENRDDNQSMKISTPSESRKQDIDNSEEHNSLDGIQNPFDNVNSESMLEGEFEHQEAPMERLNITNHGDIQPGLLVDIVTEYPTMVHVSEEPEKAPTSEGKEVSETEVHCNTNGNSPPEVTDSFTEKDKSTVTEETIGVISVITLYGWKFWNKLISCFTSFKWRFSSKYD